jgi:hypothetical protein
MTSFRQIDANRRNARKSTGPTSEEGKERSRCNAVRHGLTAETVIGSLEDTEDYKAFEAAIIADYDAQSAVERELVLRLASLLWRLRRALMVETGLFEIQANHPDEFRNTGEIRPAAREIVYAMFGQAEASRQQSTETFVDSAAEVTNCFLRLANSPNYALDRLSRYEVALWRQVDQTLFALDALDRRKPQERSRRFSVGIRQLSSNQGRDTC